MSNDFHSTGPAPLVFVVDDHAITLKMMLRCLRHEGYLAVGAGTAEEALPKIIELQPRLVLMDARLPGMSGEDASRRLHQDPATRDIPVVLCTAYSPALEVAKLADTGVVAILDKPFELAELRQIIARHMVLAAPQGSAQRG